MGDEDGVLLGLESRQMVVAFDLRLIVNSKSLSDLHKMIRHSSSSSCGDRLQDWMSRSITL